MPALDPFVTLLDADARHQTGAALAWVGPLDPALSLTDRTCLLFPDVAQLTAPAGEWLLDALVAFSARRHPVQLAGPGSKMAAALLLMRTLRQTADLAASQVGLADADSLQRLRTHQATQPNRGLVFAESVRPPQMIPPVLVQPFVPAPTASIPGLPPGPELNPALPAGLAPRPRPLEGPIEVLTFESTPDGTRTIRAVDSAASEHQAKAE